MAVTATTVAAAITMLAAVAAVFLTVLLCFYIVLCAKQYRGGAPRAGGGGGGSRAWLLRVAFGGGGADGGGGGGATEWCHEGGLDDKAMARLPRREVGAGEALDCAVCIAEVAAGEAARVLPRCGHAFHVDCVDAWLRSHSTCPLCRCPAVDDPPAVPTPVADRESPNFPTNVLFFGSQDDVSTGRARPAGALRRLVGCGGASPPPTQPPRRHDHRQHHQEEEEDAGGDIEMGLAASGESSASRPVKPPQPGS
jgi:E3 ubiquitin-protein ligase EL5